MKKPRQKPQRQTQDFHKPDFRTRLGGLGPRKGKQTESLQWSGAYRQLMTTMRATGRRGSGKKGKGGVSLGPAQERVFHRRAAVRMSYSRRARAGQWKAHGRYMERESAARSRGGFDENPGPSVQRPSSKLDQWQEAGDELLWKVIISPEDGERLDLEQYTRDVMAGVSKELGYDLEWTAVTHHNTAHPHVHVAIRGVDKQGRKVEMPKQYVKQGFRQRAEMQATQKLGYRLEQDIVLSQKRMVQQYRFNDLDRAILHKRDEQGRVFLNPQTSTAKGIRLETEKSCIERLQFLASIGLAKQTGDYTWDVSDDMQRSLRKMQQTHDRQKVMNDFGVMSSDKGLPFERTKWTNVDRVEGRVLAHGEEDGKANAYMMLEDVNGIVRLFDHRKEVEELRQRGLLQPGAYVSMKVEFRGGKAHWKIQDHGKAEALLDNEEFLKECIQRGAKPETHSFGGWLGKYREKIRSLRPCVQQHTQKL